MRFRNYVTISIIAVLVAAFNVSISTTVAYACPGGSFQTNDREFIAEGHGCDFNNAGESYGDKQGAEPKPLIMAPKFATK